MSSVARVIFYTLLQFNGIFTLNNYSRLASVHPKGIEILTHWEKDGISYQDNQMDELVVRQGAYQLRLVCKIDPALPQTEEHFRLRDSLVRFEKIYPEHYVLVGPRYWSDNMHITAVGLDIGKIESFGTFACVYGSLRKVFNVMAENLEMMKNLRVETLEHLTSTTFVRTAVLELPETSTILPNFEKPDFSCEVKKSEVAAISVHKLTPSDISVVASLGDSLLIGLGAKATRMDEFFTEYRGLSWSNGGDLTTNEILTLPNLIKRFNPQLKGYSTSIARHYEKNSGLNLASIAASSRHLQEQVRQLISNVQKSGLKNDWKVVTIMTGTRDLCRICQNKEMITPDEYIKSLVKALDTLFRDMPKTLVNLILPLNVSSLYILQNAGNCMLGNWSICPCLQNDLMRKKISNFYQGYKTLAYELIDSGIYDRSDDFTVTIQPVFEDILFDKQDRDLFSLDCLHFSAKGNAFAAAALWNNMFEPADEKLSKWSRDQKIKCFTEDSPYFSTRRNSNTGAKPRRSQDSKHRIAPGVMAAIILALLFTLAFVTAFIYLKHKLRTPLRELKFSNKPWLKYSI